MDKDELEKLGITFKPGRKGPNDKIIYYHDKPITMRELGELYALICKNEDELYPKPRFKGSTDIDRSIPQSRFNDGLIGWDKISLRSQTTIDKWAFSRSKEILGMWQRDDFMGGPTVFIPINKLLLFRTTKKKNNPEGKAIIRNAFKPWYYKTRIEKNLGRRGKAHG